jgi:hypothetical protein
MELFPLRERERESMDICYQKRVVRTKLDIYVFITSMSAISAIFGGEGYKQTKAVWTTFFLFHTNRTY